jgi:hypothetical protein
MHKYMNLQDFSDRYHNGLLLENYQFENIVTRSKIKKISRDKAIKRKGKLVHVESAGRKERTRA